MLFFRCGGGKDRGTAQPRPAQPAQGAGSPGRSRQPGRCGEGLPAPRSRALSRARASRRTSRLPRKAPRQQQEGEAGRRWAHTAQLPGVRAAGRSAANRTGPDRAGPPGYPGPSASRRAAPQRSPKRIDRGTEEEQTKPPAIPYPPAGAAAGSHSSPSPPPRCHCSPPPPSYTTVAARGTLASLAEAEPPAPPGPSRLRDRALTGNGVLRPRHGSPSAPRPHGGIGLVPRAQRAPAGRSRAPLRRRSQPVPGPGALRSCRARLHINIPKG